MQVIEDYDTVSQVIDSLRSNSGWWGSLRKGIPESKGSQDQRLSLFQNGWACPGKAAPWQEILGILVPEEAPGTSWAVARKGREVVPT